LSSFSSGGKPSSLAAVVLDGLVRRQPREERKQEHQRHDRHVIGLRDDRVEVRVRHREGKEQQHQVPNRPGDDRFDEPGAEDVEHDEHRRGAQGVDFRPRPHVDELTHPHRQFRHVRQIRSAQGG
jgi:hypothetical protein